MEYWLPFELRPVSHCVGVFLGARAATLSRGALEGRPCADATVGVRAALEQAQRDSESSTFLLEGEPPLGAGGADDVDDVEMVRAVFGTHDGAQVTMTSRRNEPLRFRSERAGAVVLVSWRQLPPTTPASVPAGALPAAAVLNLDDRGDRWRRMRVAWGGLLELRRHAASRGTSTARLPAVDGCMRSHLCAMRALRWTPRPILVMEDDAEPLEATAAELPAALAALGVTQPPSPMLPPWFVANLGPNYCFGDAPYDGPTAADAIRGTPFFSYRYACAGHMLVYSHRVLAVWDELAARLDALGDVQADNWFAQPHKWTFPLPRVLVHRGALSTQAVGFSNLSGRVMDYLQPFRDTDAGLRAAAAAAAVAEGGCAAGDALT